jgi:hypothetical protein
MHSACHDAAAATFAAATFAAAALSTAAEPAAPLAAAAQRAGGVHHLDCGPACRHGGGLAHAVLQNNQQRGLLRGRGGAGGVPERHAQRLRGLGGAGRAAEWRAEQLRCGLRCSRRLRRLLFHVHIHVSAAVQRHAHARRAACPQRRLLQHAAG